MESVQRLAWTSSGGWDAYKHRGGYPTSQKATNFFTKPCNQIGPELKRKPK